jgi:hypothetical protein
MYLASNSGRNCEWSGSRNDWEEGRIISEFMQMPNPLMRKIKSLSRELAPNESLEMPIRLFQLICLVVTVLTLFIILPVNLLQNLPILVNVGDVLLGLFALFCFWESTRNRHHKFLFLIVMVLLMEPIW